MQSSQSVKLMTNPMENRGEQEKSSDGTRDSAKNRGLN